MTTFNPKLQAVISIRNLVKGISSEWIQLTKAGAEVDSLVDNTLEIISTVNNEELANKWELELDRYSRNVNSLQGIMSKVRNKIKAKDPSALTEIWNDHKQYATALQNNLNTLYNLGIKFLPETKISEWNTVWDDIFSQFNGVRDVAGGCSLQLEMIENYAPDEIDELTDTILKHIPTKYSSEEAAQYEKEYVEAYEQLKKEASQKKNLWDKFLDILAGGNQQTPAQMVMMQRWVNGEKGD
ncbi:hypothetical protein [Aureibaculum conchae]|uniref:hypothetical protein n=1 Tax=Aureibaculum sp. 2308TA14-22 TaxID=3108392 RepID=UPI00339A8250